MGKTVKIDTEMVEGARMSKGSGYCPRCKYRGCHNTVDYRQYHNHSGEYSMDFQDNHRSQSRV